MNEEKLIELRKDLQSWVESIDILVVKSEEFEAMLRVSRPDHDMDKTVDFMQSLIAQPIEGFRAMALSVALSSYEGTMQ